MADLLLELFSEEIPAGLQKRSAEELKKRITDGLKQAGCDFDEAHAYATPRRLALSATGLPERQPDVKEERKGPESRRARQGDRRVSRRHRPQPGSVRNPR